MKALIAFIVMAAGIVTLIEINERIKAKRRKAKGEGTKEDCQKVQAGAENCSGCELMEVCENKHN